MSDELDITIRAPGDKKYPVKISSTATVAELKAKVQAETEIEADRQRLIYSGRVSGVVFDIVVIVLIDDLYVAGTKG